MTKRSTYSEKLQDPRWQKLRLEIFQRDKWACSNCGATDKPLHIHHGYYQFGREPWEYERASLYSYCQDCHADADNAREELKVWAGRMTLGQQISLLGIIGHLAVLSDEVAEDLLEQICDLTLEHAKAKSEEDYTPKLEIKPA